MAAVNMGGTAEVRKAERKYTPRRDQAQWVK